jgi:hypothetical protein
LANSVRIHAGVKDDASGPIDKIRDKFGALQKQGAKGFAIGVGAAVTTKALDLMGSAASRAVQFVGDSIQAASSLAESQSKVNVVFGQSAAEITKWADTASDAFGQSKQQALEAAGTYGNLFQAFGVGQQEATKMSKSLVELAADLASFNNTSVDDALLALRSGLSGETEPLKRYGIALSDARLRQELLAQGMTDLGATLTPLQKSTAAYALIMKDSSLAQGDFARTSDGLANKQRILEAKLADLSAEIGTKLLPLMTDLAGAAIAVVDSLGELGNALAGVGDVISWLAARGRDIPAIGEIIFGPDQQRNVASNIGHTSAAIRGFVDESVSTVEGMRARMGVVAGYSFQVLPQEFEAAKNRTKAIAQKTPGEIAAALLSKRKDWKSAVEQLVKDGEDALTPWAERAQIKAALASKAVKDGLASNDPAIRAQWAAFVTEAEMRLGELSDSAFNLTFRAGTEIGRALAATKAGTAAAAQLHNIAIQNALGQLPSSAYGWGYSVGRETAAGLKASTPVVKQAADQVAAAVRNRLRVASPAKEGPWSEAGGPEGWGRRFTDLLAKGIGAKLPNITPPGFGAMAPALAGAGGSSTVTNNYNLTVSGTLQPMTEQGIAMTMQRLAGFNRG